MKGTKNKTGRKDLKLKRDPFPRDPYEKCFSRGLEALVNQ
jgi:hypothetical protein